MVQTYIKTASAIAALTLALHPLSGVAQQAQNGQWFVPGQTHPAAPPPGARPNPRPASSPSAAPGGGAAG